MGEGVKRTSITFATRSNTWAAGVLISEREGEIYISDYEVIQHNSSLSLQEEETQEKKKPEKQLTIDEVEEEIVVYLDPERM